MVTDQVSCQLINVITIMSDSSQHLRSVVDRGKLRFPFHFLNLERESDIQSGEVGIKKTQLKMTISISIKLKKKTYGQISGQRFM